MEREREPALDRADFSGVASTALRQRGGGGGRADLHLGSFVDSKKACTMRHRGHRNLCDLLSCGGMAKRYPAEVLEPCGEVGQ